MITLGGLICIRNGNLLDYTWRESIKSLLPVCDRVFVCDADSQDGTLEELQDWAEKEPKLRITHYPWPNPKGDADFWVKWINAGRVQMDTDYQLQLDADEVLSEDSYPAVLQFKEIAGRAPRFSVWCHRLNFWKDPFHLIPHGHCCGHRVVRFGPQAVWMPSDGPHPLGAPMVNMAVDSGIQIFHYGFLRDRAAFFRKAKALQGMFWDHYDPRLVEAEEKTKDGGNWMEVPGICHFQDKLVPYTGKHPKVAWQWLADRGFPVGPVIQFGD